MTGTTLKNFRTGDILVREGDPSDVVFRLVSGIVEIQREVGGQPIVLGRIGEGEFIGEMGVIENRPHLATARAESDGVAEVLSIEQFFDRIASDSSAALELIMRLSARLRKADDELVRAGPRRSHVLAPVTYQSHIIRDNAEGAPADNAAPADSRVTIAADTTELRAEIGGDPISVGERPFVVGRNLQPGESWPQYTPDIIVKVTKPYVISRNHFMIDRKVGHLIVRDMNSTLGTSVNGRAIGRHFNKDWVPLHIGANKIVAGGLESRFKFIVTVS